MFDAWLPAKETVENVDKLLPRVKNQAVIELIMMTKYKRRKKL